MKPGDLRRFKDSLIAGGRTHLEGSNFMVLKVDMAGRNRVTHTVDVLINDRCEEGWGYHWVEDSSETINEAG
jgi:hypothetical protein